jgi:hypothetical protein
MPDSAPTRATALASPLRQFTGWTLTMNCPACRVLRSLSVEALMSQHAGAVTTVAAVIARFRRRRCGSEPDWVRLADGQKWQGRPVREVMLLQDRP